ncbi:hypothetical protein BAE44_0014331, partial [Dichanthelium oligosanthes]
LAVAKALSMSGSDFTVTDTATGALVLRIDGMLFSLCRCCILVDADRCHVLGGGVAGARWWRRGVGPSAARRRGAVRRGAAAAPGRMARGQARPGGGARCGVARRRRRGAWRGAKRGQAARNIRRVSERKKLNRKANGCDGSVRQGTKDKLDVI